MPGSSSVAVVPVLETLAAHARPLARAELAPRRRPSRLPLPRALLCDLDGTLIDSMPTLADIASEVMESTYGTSRAAARELYLGTCGVPFAAQLEEIFPGDPRTPGASDRFEAAKPARCGAIQMPAGTRRALERLRGS